MAALAMMIARTAGQQGLRSVANMEHTGDCTYRVWWYGRQGNEQIFQEGLADKEAVVRLERGYLSSSRNSSDLLTIRLPLTDKNKKHLVKNELSA